MHDEATTYEAYKAANDRLRELTEGMNEAESDDFAHVFRMMLTSLPDLGNEDLSWVSDLEPNEARWVDACKEIIAELFAYRFGGRDRITELCINDSLCPIHFCDWMSCFDDDDPECAQVRAIYPCSHDT